ncbi:ROK family transcriptional regulator [Alteromonadaceae bacterium BrNp21-10]|nr:ROK family transcriptional regulator [Alteromonadaceae bacterium BrNp21-10]
MYKRIIKTPPPTTLALPSDRYFFHCLKVHGPMSRAEIAQHTHISRPTISESAQRLLSQFIVIETQRKTQNKKGRAGLIYEINCAKGITIALAVDSKQIQIIVTTIAQKTLNKITATIAPNSSKQQFMDFLIATAVTAVKGIESPVLAIGISVADPIDIVTGQVIPLPCSPFPLAHGINFRELFAQHFNCPVSIDNDVNWATLAEKSLGVAKQQTDFIFVYLGEGIGAGIYLANQLVRGGEGLAGEIGYIKVNGHRNLQDYVVELNLKAEIQSGTNLHQHIAIDAIAQVIASTSIIVNPQMVVIGGPLSESSQFFDALIDATLPKLIKNIHIVRSAMPHIASVTGAALGATDLALESLGLPAPN